MRIEAPGKRLVRFGPFQADLEQRVLTKNGVRVRLQGQPFQVLALLLERAGETVTREEARQRIWASDTFVEFDDGLNTAIKKLRVALGDAADNPIYIETVPRRGYRFVAPISMPVEESAAPESAGEAEISPLHTVVYLEREVPPVATNRKVNPGLAALVGLGVLLAGSGLAYWRAGKGVRASTVGQSVQSLAMSSENPEAMQDYLQGTHYWALRTDGGLPKAVEYFNRSLAEDPNFARSYAALANCYIVYPMFTGAVSQTVAYPKATEAAHKALALDPLLPEAHLAAAEVAFYVDWDFAKAEQEFERTLLLNPNFATAHQWYGEFLSLLGRHAEAIREDEMATRLDPGSAVAHHQLGTTYQQARQYDRAIVEYQRAIQLSPSYGLSYHAIMWARRRQGKYGEAMASMQNAIRLYSGSAQDMRIANQMAAAYAHGGRVAFLKKEIQWAAGGPRPGLYLARDYAELGNKPMALYWLRRAYQTHDIEVLNMNSDPEFDGMRSDPQFQALTKAIGFRQGP